MISPAHFNRCHSNCYWHEARSVLYQVSWVPRAIIKRNWTVTPCFITSWYRLNCLWPGLGNSDHEWDTLKLVFPQRLKLHPIGENQFISCYLIHRSKYDFIKGISSSRYSLGFISFHLHHLWLKEEFNRVNSEFCRSPPCLPGIKLRWESDNKSHSYILMKNIRAGISGVCHVLWYNIRIK